MPSKTQVITVHPDYPELDKIGQCAKVIKKGGLVVFPTETVYGIAADFNNPKAMQKLMEVKKRSPEKPTSIVISQKGLIANYTPTNDTAVFKLIDEYWPGPLTVVVPSKEEGETIGIRMPNHAVALRLVEEAHCTVAAPSANFEGNPPPKTCEEALRDMDGLVDLAIDGGPAYYGQASSMVDFTQEKPAVLREGAITSENVEKATGRKVILFVCTGNSCRSVMAEYLLRKKVAHRDDIEVFSAGTSVFLRSSASRETIAVLKREEIDATFHVSQPLNSVFVKKADLILVMTKMHRQQVLDRVPSAEKRIYLLKEFASGASEVTGDLDVPDPMGRPPEAYDECVTTIKEAIDKVVELI